MILTSCSTQRGFPPDHQVPNLDVVDGFLYRSAQPNHQGFAYLKSIGIKCVVNLRADPLPDERATVTALGMHYVAYPMSGTHTPTLAELEALLKAIEAQTGPVLVHCQFGCDRTGIIVAYKRVRKDNWSAAEALAEAKAYGMSSLLPNFHRLILSFK